MKNRCISPLTSSHGFDLIWRSSEHVGQFNEVQSDVSSTLLCIIVGIRQRHLARVVRLFHLTDVYRNPCIVLNDVFLLNVLYRADLSKMTSDRQNVKNLQNNLLRRWQKADCCNRATHTTHTHTHTQPFYGPFSGTTWVSRCQKRTSGLYGARGD